jgi:hypothetical protein
MFLTCLVLVLTFSHAWAYPGNTAPAGNGAAASVTSANVGTVVETMNSGGYTYALLENNGMQNWAAMPPTELKVGDNVELKSGMAMQNFSSKTLNRTFDTIYFTQGVVKR